MKNTLRFELSFKNILELENKLSFCTSNEINKINIPCKGVLKKELLTETVEYIGKNYKELDVIYHYSLYHQYSKNIENSYSEFINFIQKCNLYENTEILVVSGSKKKKNFESLDVMRNLKNEKNLVTKFGIAYNPYLEKYYRLKGEQLNFEKKFSLGLTRSIWLQFGTDINLLKSEIKFLNSYIDKFSSSLGQNVKIYGSVLFPSRQFISRFKFRPWKGVYISDEYLNSLEKFYNFTKHLIQFYLENNICPLIETEFTSIDKIEKIYTLLKKINI